MFGAFISSGIGKCSVFHFFTSKSAALVTSLVVKSDMISYSGKSGIKKTLAVFANFKQIASNTGFS